MPRGSLLRNFFISGESTDSSLSKALVRSFRNAVPPKVLGQGRHVRNGLRVRSSGGNYFADQHDGRGPTYDRFRH